MSTTWIRYVVIAVVVSSFVWSDALGNPVSECSKQERALMTRLEAAIQEMPEHERGEKGLQLLLDNLDSMESRAGKAKFQKAIAMLERASGKTQAAVQRLEGIVKNYWDTGVGIGATYLLIEYHQQRFEYAKVADTALSVLDQKPLPAFHRIELTGRLGAALVATGNTREAMSVVNRLDGLYPDSENHVGAVCEEVASTAMGLGQFEQYYKEMSWINEHLTRYARQARFLGNYAHACQTAGHDVKAVAIYTRLIEQHPEEERLPSFLLETGNLLAKMKDYAGATAFYEHLMRLDAKDEYTRRLQGLARGNSTLILEQTLYGEALRELDAIDALQGLEEENSLVQKEMLMPREDTASVDKGKRISEDDSSSLLGANTVDTAENGNISLLAVCGGVLIAAASLSILWKVYRRNSRRRSAGSVVLLAVSVFGFGTYSSAQAPKPDIGQKPALTADRRQMDFGRVVSGSVATGSVILTNDTANPVEISRVRTSCSCLKAEANTSFVKPGGIAVIRISLDTTGMKGEYRGRVRILPPNKDALTAIEVHAFVEALVSVKPRLVMFPLVRTDKCAQKEFVLRSIVNGLKWRVDRIRADEGGFMATVHENPVKKENPSGPHFLVEVTPKNIGRFSGHIVLSAELPEESQKLRVYVPLLVEGIGPVRAEPNQVWFSSLKGCRLEKPVALKMDKGIGEVVVREVEYDKRFVTVRVNTEHGASPVLEIEAKQSAFSHEKSIRTPVKATVFVRGRTHTLSVPIVLLRNLAAEARPTGKRKSDFTGQDNVRFFVGTLPVTVLSLKDGGRSIGVSRCGERSALDLAGGLLVQVKQGLCTVACMGSTQSSARWIKVLPSKGHDQERPNIEEVSLPPDHSQQLIVVCLQGEWAREDTVTSVWKTLCNRHYAQAHLVIVANLSEGFVERITNTGWESQFPQEKRLNPAPQAIDKKPSFLSYGYFGLAAVCVALVVLVLVRLRRKRTSGR